MIETLTLRKNANNFLCYGKILKKAYSKNKTLIIVKDEINLALKATAFNAVRDLKRCPGILIETLHSVRLMTRVKIDRALG
jgi:hypothetical protein